MGQALFRLQRNEEALEWLDAALALQPDPPRAGLLLRLMGQAAQALGRTEAAAQHYERAVALDPHDAEAVDLLAATQAPATSKAVRSRVSRRNSTPMR